MGKLVRALNAIWLHDKSECAHTLLYSRAAKCTKKVNKCRKKKKPTCTLTIKHTHVHTKNEHTDFEKAINSR